MSFAQIMEQEARLIMLRTLAEQPDQRLNSSLLQSELAERWGINRSRDWVHTQLGFLAHEVGAVTLVDAGTVRIASLTARGLDHVERRVVLPGVKRPSPEA
jgi:glutaminase